MENKLLRSVPQPFRSNAGSRAPEKFTLGLYCESFGCHGLSILLESSKNDDLHSK